MMGDLVDRAYEGSAAAAAMQLLDGGSVSAQELEQLRKLLDRKAEEDGT
jgi:predicted transcriptional regulator